MYVWRFLKLANLSKLIFCKFFQKKIGRFYMCVYVFGRLNLTGSICVCRSEKLASSICVCMYLTGSICVCGSEKLAGSICVCIWQLLWNGC